MKLQLAIQFSRYGGIAIVSAVVDYLTFTVLYFLEAGLFPAQMVARISGGLFSFLTNKYWNFKVRGLWAAFKEGRRFLLVYCFSYLLSLSLIYTFVKVLEVPVYPAKLAADATCFLLNFIALRSYVFNDRTGVSEYLHRAAKALRKTA